MIADNSSEHSVLELARLYLRSARARYFTRVFVQGFVGACLVTMASRVSVSFAGTVVPFTLQPQAVLCVAAYLGPVSATAAIVEYLLAGALGLPVFAGGLGGAMYLVGPTSGFLWSYLLAAPLVGLFANRRWDVSLLTFLGASGLTLLCGALGLTLMFDTSTAWAFGVAPFWRIDIVKAVLSFVVYRLGVFKMAAQRGAFADNSF